MNSSENLLYRDYKRLQEVIEHTNKEEELKRDLEISYIDPQ
jgi:hypothetical protein